MVDPSSLLKYADPLRDEREEELLSPEDAQSIRRAMIAAAPAGASARPFWSRPLVLAAAAAVILTVSGIVGLRVGFRPASPEAPSAASAQVLASGGGERRQLQFSTPGGTRIIWIFDDSLRLQEPMP